MAYNPDDGSWEGPTTPRPLPPMPKPRGLNKGTAKVAPAAKPAALGNGKLTAAEHAGIPHPIMAQFNKK
jgi:hypothetical protein